MQLTSPLYSELRHFGRAIISIITLYFATAVCCAQTPQDISFKAEIDGTEQKYVLVPPPDYDPEQFCSVMIALHGHGSDRWQFVRDDRDECRAARDAATKYRMIYVSPDYRARTSWMGPAAEADVVQILRELRTSCRIDQVVISGGSMGGTAALTFAALHPKLVDGVVSMNGTANFLEYDQFQDAISQSFGGSRTAIPDEYRKRSAELHADRLDMPVAITTGGLDTLVPPSSTLRLAQTLSEKQRQVHLIHRPQGGHSTDYADATEAFDFVCTRLSKARETSPLIHLNQEPGTIVCLGDSVTGVYYHSGGTFAYPELLELGIRQAFPDSRIRVINAGISGNTTQDGLARLDRDVLAHQPNLVTISFGLNDMTRIPEQDFEANLKTLAERCRQAGSKVLLCTPNSVLSSTGRPVETLVRYCDIIRSLGHRMQIPVCDQYSAGESLRRQDARTWQLMLSDDIHPNLDGHRMMADELCHSITGKRASLHDMQLPLDPLTFSRKSIQNKQPVRVLAMPPFDEIAVATLRDAFPEATFEVTRWDVAGKSLHEIELSASALVRPAKPTLVVIAIPDDASAENEELFIHAWTWTMNWSLSFGHREWDCVVVHPDVARTNAEYQHAELVRTLVRAQGVPLIDRPAGSKDSKDVLFQRGLGTNE